MRFKNEGAMNTNSGLMECEEEAEVLIVNICGAYERTHLVLRRESRIFLL